jgi:hypothetical protein
VVIVHNAAHTDIRCIGTTLRQNFVEEQTQTTTFNISVQTVTRINQELSGRE